MRAHRYVAIHFIGQVCAGPVLLILVYCTLLHKTSGRDYRQSIKNVISKNHPPAVPHSITNQKDTQLL